MGYWGHLLLACSKQPLANLQEARAFGQPDHERRLADDWSVLWIGREPPADFQRALMPIVGATRRPALVAHVLDSDCAPVAARAPSGLQWTAVLNRATAGASYEGVADGFETADRALAGALRWSREAGLTPGEEVLRRALTDDRTFAEDLFDQLLVGLGIPGARLDA